MTGGGAATNSGIDFQARVGALAMVSMVADLLDLGSLGLGDHGQVPLEVRFETNDHVDDIVLVLASSRILIQAKNTLSLTTGHDSELAKVIRQVVGSHLVGGAADRHLLVVSPQASSRIRLQLRKICQSHRLNASGVAANPLSKTERETLVVAKRHIRREFQTASGRNCNKETVAAIFRSLDVETVDIASGSTGERMATTALAAAATVSPELIWRSLIALSLVLSRDRMSIDQPGLSARFAPYLATPGQDSQAPAMDDILRLAVQGEVSMGREVLLAQQDDGTTCVAELRRFNEDGSRRLRFGAGHVELPNGATWKVVRRTATTTGMLREFGAGLLDGIDGEVVVFESSLGDVENDPMPTLHAAAYRESIDSIQNGLTCLVCGRSISQNQAYSIEVDDGDHPYQVGLVHRGCLLPMHRVLGIVRHDDFASSPSLIDFDYRSWIQCLRGGQGAWNSTHQGGFGRPLKVGWNPENAMGTTGGWAVAYGLSDGESRYMMTRGRVHRGNRVQAEGMAEQLNESIATGHASGDPWVVGVRGYGQRSVVVSADDPNPPKVLSFRAIEVTEATVSATNANKNYYAPVFSLADLHTGQPFEIGGASVLLTNPLRFEEHKENWCAAGIVPPTEVSTTILASDRDFDFYLARAQQASRAVLVDPVLKSDGELIGGFFVTSLSDFTTEGHSKATDELYGG